MKNLVRVLFVQFVFLFLAATVITAQTPTIDDTSKTFEVRLPVTIIDKDKKKSILTK